MLLEFGKGDTTQDSLFEELAGLVHQNPRSSSHGLKLEVDTLHTQTRAIDGYIDARNRRILGDMTFGPMNEISQTIKRNVVIFSN